MCIIDKHVYDIYRQQFFTSSLVTVTNLKVPISAIVSFLLFAPEVGEGCIFVCFVYFFVNSALLLFSWVMWGCLWRFEMPYNIWCDGCGNHVAMGVRYNAEKSKIGMYYTTPIYKFRMKCHLCDNHFEIKTDPAVWTWSHQFFCLLDLKLIKFHWT